MINKINALTKKLLYVLTPTQKILGVLVMACSLISAMLETLGVSVIIPLVSALLEPAKLREYEIIDKLCLRLNIDSDVQLVNIVIWGVIGLYILKNLYFVLFSWLKVKYANKVQRETAVYMLESYMRRGYRFIMEHNSNELRQCVENDVNSLYNILTSYIQIITQTVIALLICIFMCITDYQIAVSVILASVACITLILLIFKKTMIRVGVRYRQYSIISSKILLEVIHGCKEVFVMHKQVHFLERFKDNLAKRQNEHAKQSFSEEIPAYLIEAVCITCIMLALKVKISTLTDTTTFVAILASFAVGAFRVLPALGKISSSANQIIASIPGLDAIYENVVGGRECKEIFDILDDNNSGDNVDCFNNNITVSNICFRYNDSLDYVLKGLNIDIKKGNAIALVGESGAGKSTLADIILGLIKSESGEITVDGNNILSIPRSWSKMIGFVPQTIYLFDASISENVAFGVDPEDIDINQLNEALRKANLLGFVESLPDGINTIVGDRGMRLSGGQRQRIGIARALYHNPQILILDEATSALDNETESAVMEAIESLQGSITMIIIAHRITTIRNCDHIYKIENGIANEVSYEDIQIIK